MKLLLLDFLVQIKKQLREFNNENLTWKGLSLNIIEPVKLALILKYDPEWNLYKEKISKLKIAM